MTGVDDLLDRRRPAEKTVGVVDGLLQSRIEAKRREIAVARTSDFGTLDSPVEGLEAELKALIVEADEMRIVFTFRALPRAEFEDLQDGCPPTEDQREEGFGFNPDTFCPTLIAASCVSLGGRDDEPALTREQAQRIWDEWSAGDADALFDAAYKVNTQARVHPFDVIGSEETRGSDQSSDTASPEESPTASS